jgi:hypothetical protein
MATLSPFTNVFRLVTSMVFVTALGTAPNSAQSAVLYRADFEGAAVGPANPSSLGFDSAVGGAPGAPQWEITSSGGANNSKGFSVSFDTSNSSFYIVGFGPTLPSSDLGDLIAASQIRFSMDAKTTGAVASAPIEIQFSQFDSHYEQDRGIDANHDGDINDGAQVFHSTFDPPLMSLGDYFHMSFTLDKGIIDANIVRAPSIGLPFAKFPLTPMFDPAVPLAIGISFGSSGFGFDSGNVAMFDNLLVESVPEPSTLFVVCSILPFLLTKCRSTVAFRSKST